MLQPCSLNSMITFDCKIHHQPNDYFEVGEIDMSGGRAPYILLSSISFINHLLSITGPCK